MTISLHFWLRLSMLFLGLWGCGWLISVVWRRRRENGLTTPVVTMNLLLKQKARTALTNTAKIGLGMALGVLLGMGIRDRQLINNQYTYTDVSILNKFAEREFRIWPDRMKQQQVTICAESTVDWREGELLADWTFEQKQGCKRVIIYHKKPKGELNASIQMR